MGRPLDPNPSEKALYSREYYRRMKAEDPERYKKHVQDCGEDQHERLQKEEEMQKHQKRCSDRYRERYRTDEAFREKQLEGCRARYQENLEDRREWQRQYYLAHKEQVLIRAKEWYQKNKQRILEERKQQRAAERQNKE
mgnify:CR=1 FL=1